MVKFKGYLEIHNEREKINTDAAAREAKLKQELENLQKAMARLETDHSNPAELTRLEQQAIQLRIKLGLPS